MAKNRIRKDGLHISIAATDPATPASGDPIRFGPLTGVSLGAESALGNASGNTSADFGPSVWDLSAKAIDDNGNVAIAIGDRLNYVDGDTPVLSKKSGRPFGIALEAITSGSTDTINVLHLTQFGGGLGYIPIPLTAFREVTTNATINAAGNGGLLASDTTPIYERVNAATDKKARLNWASSNSDEIIADFAYPPDLDDAAPLTVHLLMRSAGATDTPTVAVSYFEGVGDTNAGGNTAALSTTVADKAVTIAASDVGAYPNAASIGVVVGAHTTDAVYLYGAWITYQKK